MLQHPVISMLVLACLTSCTGGPIGSTVSSAASAIPSAIPSAMPSAIPSAIPSAMPTPSETALPTATPTQTPTTTPTETPAPEPDESSTNSCALSVELANVTTITTPVDQTKANSVLLSYQSILTDDAYVNACQMAVENSGNCESACSELVGCTDSFDLNVCQSRCNALRNGSGCGASKSPEQVVREIATTANLSQQVVHLIISTAYPKSWTYVLPSTPATSPIASVPDLCTASARFVIVTSDSTCPSGTASNYPFTSVPKVGDLYGRQSLPSGTILSSGVAMNSDHLLAVQVGGTVKLPNPNHQTIGGFNLFFKGSLAILGNDGNPLAVDFTGSGATSIVTLPNYHWIQVSSGGVSLDDLTLRNASDHDVLYIGSATSFTTANDVVVSSWANSQYYPDGEYRICSYVAGQNIAQTLSFVKLPSSISISLDPSTTNNATDIFAKYLITADSWRYSQSYPGLYAATIVDGQAFGYVSLSSAFPDDSESPLGWEFTGLSSGHHTYGITLYGFTDKNGSMIPFPSEVTSSMTSITLP